MLGSFLRDVAKLNEEEAEFPSLRSRRDSLKPVAGCLLITNRQWDAREFGNDEFLARKAEFSIRCSARTSVKVGWKATC